MSARLSQAMTHRLNDVNAAAAALQELGLSARQAEAMVAARRETGWTPEQRDALRRFCDAAK